MTTYWTNLLDIITRHDEGLLTTDEAAHQLAHTITLLHETAQHRLFDAIIAAPADPLDAKTTTN